MDIPDTAASFIAGTTSLFPAAGPPAGVLEVDPQQVERKFDQYLGKLIVVKGKVLASKPVVTANGIRATYIGLQTAAPKGRAQSEFFIIYKGPGRFARDSTVKAYILPVDLVPYNTGARQAKAVLSIGMYVQDQPRVPASTTPAQ